MLDDRSILAALRGAASAHLRDGAAAAGGVGNSGDGYRGEVARSGDVRVILTRGARDLVAQRLSGGERGGRSSWATIGPVCCEPIAAHLAGALPGVSALADEWRRDPASVLRRWLAARGVVGEGDAPRRWPNCLVWTAPDYSGVVGADANHRVAVHPLGVCFGWQLVFAGEWRAAKLSGGAVRWRTQKRFARLSDVVDAMSAAVGVEDGRALSSDAVSDVVAARARAMLSGVPDDPADALASLNIYEKNNA